MERLLKGLTRMREQIDVIGISNQFPMKLRFLKLLGTTKAYFPVLFRQGLKIFGPISMPSSPIRQYL